MVDVFVFDRGLFGLGSASGLFGLGAGARKPSERRTKVYEEGTLGEIREKMNATRVEMNADAASARLDMYKRRLKSLQACGGSISA